MEKMLFATSNSRSEPLKYIKDELKNVENSVSGYIKIIEKSSITYTKLKKAIEENNDITMLHYSGHSDKDGFNIDKDGNTVDISKEDIANLVKSCPNLRLVFFNSCYSEDFANEIFKINPNIPYVIGTKKAVNDYLASLVAFVFYRNLTIDSSRNIELAFNLTRAELEDNYDNGFENILSKISLNNLDKGKEELTTNTRSLGKRETTRFWWEKHENPNISPSQQEWTLIPKANLVLSKEENKDKIKILCIYGNDKESIDCYEAISRVRLNENQKICNGIWNISKDFKTDDFKTEYKSANIVVHFLNDSTYVSTIETHGIHSIIENYPDKIYCFLPLKGTFDILQDKTWYNENLILETPAKLDFFGFGKKFLDIKEKAIGKSDLEIFDTYFSESFNNITNKVSEKTDISKLSDDLKVIPFSKELSKFSNFDNKVFNYAFISGTENCTQELLIKNLKGIVATKNIETIKVIRSIQNDSQNADNELFKATNFWKRLLTELRIDIAELTDKLMAGKTPKDICIDKLSDKRLHNNIILILDDINFTDFKSLIYGDFKTKLENNTDESEFKIFVLASAYKIEEIDDTNHILVSPLKKTDFITWTQTNLNIKNYSKYKEISIESILGKDDGEQYRKIAMEKICTKLGDTNPKNTILKILNLNID